MDSIQKSRSNNESQPVPFKQALEAEIAEAGRIDWYADQITEAERLFNLSRSTRVEAEAQAWLEAVFGVSLAGFALEAWVIGALISQEKREPWIMRANRPLDKGETKVGEIFEIRLISLADKDQRGGSVTLEDCQFILFDNDLTVEVRPNEYLKSENENFFKSIYYSSYIKTDSLVRALAYMIYGTLSDEAISKRLADDELEPVIVPS